LKIRTDFVTNSSSSCFVVETGENVRQVKKALQKILKGYAIMLDGDVLPYNGIFQEPYVYTEEMYDDNAEEAKQYGEENLFWQYQSEQNIGKVIVMSASDNTVPWDICEIIERRFKTRREHLG
jgi:hypothetical protein